MMEIQTLLENFTDVQFCILAAVLVFIAIVIWYSTEKVHKNIGLFYCYPPEGCDSTDVTFLYKGYLNSKDAVSLIFYLASKGYIKISKTTVSKLGFNLGLEKLKEYDGNNENEKNMMDSLFEENDKIYREDLLILSSENGGICSFDSFNRYKETFKAIRRGSANVAIKMNCNENKRKIFEKRSWSVTFLMLIFSISILTTFFLTSGNDSMRLIAFLSIALFVSMMLWLKKRTAYGEQMKAEIKGLKTFFSKAKPEIIEDLKKEPSEYVFDMLAYAIALDCIYPYLKNFKSYINDYPEWLETDVEFSKNNCILEILKISNFFNSLFSS